MKKKTIIILSSVLAGVTLITGTVLTLGFNSIWYKIPKQDEHIENKTNLVQAHNRALYDKNGDILSLRGLNIGNVFLQEGWMSPFALEPSKNEDGTYQRDKDGNYIYPEFTEEEFREGLKSNPKLKDRNLEEMMDYYYSCMITEEDFSYIKNELKMNVIRLPFYYRNILNDDLSLKSEEEAFKWLDWYITNAKENDLYVILDLHGCPGSQNGLLHSGSNSTGVDFWKYEKNQDAVLKLWDFVSNYYTNVKPELGERIATYDLLNEPTWWVNGQTTKEIHKYYDKLYDVIRENNDEHVLCLEGCWGFDNLPNPKDYGWENVQYSYHWYNWKNDTISYDLFYLYKDFENLFRNYNVPVFIGEFTCFSDKGAWLKTLNMFDERYYSWTIWSYKVISQGWWDNSWGIKVNKLYHDEKNGKMKTNVSTCTYEEYIETCNSMKNEHSETGVLKEVIDEYNRKRGL